MISGTGNFPAGGGGLQHNRTLEEAPIPHDFFSAGKRQLPCIGVCRIDHGIPFEPGDDGGHQQDGAPCFGQPSITKFICSEQRFGCARFNCLHPPLLRCSVEIC